MLYVTPGLYRNMGFKADTSSMSDQELTMQLRIASGLATRYCNRPGSYDFRGGSITDEKHAWWLGNEHDPRGITGIRPKFLPVRELSSFDIYVSNTQHLSIDTDRVNYGVGNYLTPVVAASSIGVWSYSAIPIAGFPVPECRISYTYGFAHSDENEELFPEGGGAYRASNQWWSGDDVVVMKNGTPLTVTTDYTIDYDEGLILLSQAQEDAMDLDDVITCTYTHLLPEDVRDATAVITSDLIGATAIAGAGLQGLRMIRAEEIELMTDTNSAIATGEISDRAKMLLAAYREFSWG